MTTPPQTALNKILNCALPDQRWLAPGSALTQLRHLLQDLSLDQATFVGKYNFTQADLIELLRDRISADSWPGGCGVMSLVTLFAEGIALSSRYGAGGVAASPQEILDLQSLVTFRSSTANFIRAVFGIPDEIEGITLDWSTLRLHRLGTTSLIFRLEQQHLERQRLILKISHVLFTTVGPIASASASYADDWKSISVDCPYLVRVWSSGIGWILEEYIDGPTLREFLDELRDNDQHQSLSTRRDTYLAVLEATSALHHATAGRGHGDLNPSNIILQNRMASHPQIANMPSGPRFAARLIDMGRNLLASETIGRVHSADSKYVAPEVISLPPQEREVSYLADYYSLGHLLGLVFGYSESDGFYFLAERLYRNLPDIARVAAKLLDESPAHRALSVRSFERRQLSIRDIYDLRALGSYISELSAILERIQGQGFRSAKSGLRLLLQSLYGDLSQVIDEAKVLRGLLGGSDTLRGIDRVGAARVLVSGLIYFLTLTLILVSIAGAGPGAGMGFSHLLGKSAHETIGQRAQIWIAGSTFTVACFQYCVRAFGDISFGRSSVRVEIRLLSEFLLWSLSVIVFPCVALSLYLGYKYWLWFAFSGLFFVCANNGVTAWARRVIHNEIVADPIRRRWLENSRVAQEADTEILAYWTPTVVAFTFFVMLLAALAAVGVVHDFGIDAGAIAAINIFVFSWSQVGRQGPKLRGNLSQYCVAGENLRRLR